MEELSKEARAARAAYLRDWRKKHPDKVRQYEINRWERIAQKLAAESEHNLTEGEYDGATEKQS